MNRNVLGAMETRLIEINGIVEKLDVSIRASAFELLKVYVTSGDAENKSPSDHQNSIKPSASSSSLSDLLETHSHEKPSDNVHLLVANWYSNYGSTPFAPNDIRDTAAASGLTVPEHLRMTLRSAQDSGKKLYQSAGRGLFKRTVTGELFLRKTYSVTKGTGNHPTPTN